jgi:hypothetical protein
VWHIQTIALLLTNLNPAKTISRSSLWSLSFEYSLEFKKGAKLKRAALSLGYEGTKDKLGFLFSPSIKDIIWVRCSARRKS